MPYYIFVEHNICRFGFPYYNAIRRNSTYSYEITELA